METIAKQLELEYPKFDKGSGVRVLSLRDSYAANFRPALLIFLSAVGFVLLTLGMLAGFGIGRVPSSFKLGWSIGVWLLYGGILIAQWVRHLAPRRVANLSVLASCLAIATLWGITFRPGSRARLSLTLSVIPSEM